MPNGPGSSVSDTWYGQSGFRLAAGDSRVLVDPFLSERDDRNYPPPATAADFADVTQVLCTHEHADHLDLPFLREFCAVNAAARIIVPAPVATIASAGGLDPARLTSAVPGEDLPRSNRSTSSPCTTMPSRATPATRATSPAWSTRPAAPPPS